MGLRQFVVLVGILLLLFIAIGSLTWREANVVQEIENSTSQSLFTPFLLGLLLVGVVAVALIIILQDITV